MSVQIFLQGKLIGIEDFLLSAASPAVSSSDAESLLCARSHWITLLSEILPRALLAELGLARILLGSSGGGQFLVVLPAEARLVAEQFLESASRDIGALGGSGLRLVWAATENLGDWNIVRKRLSDEIQHRSDTPAATRSAELFPPDGNAPADASSYPLELWPRLADVREIGWSPDSPGRVLINNGKHRWTINGGADQIQLARHVVQSDLLELPATASELGGRAQGRNLWGVLRGDVDNLGIRLRRVHSIEEHVQLSVMYKQFFAGELQVLCSLPDYWRKVTILYSGGDDFAVYGAWDALIAIAPELQRLFHRLSEANLKDFPGPEGKTITMALALAGEDSGLAEVYAEAGRQMEAAKSTDKDSFSLLGRTLEWRQIAEAAEIRDMFARMVTEFGCPPQLLVELGGFYREASAPTVTLPQASRRVRGSQFERPWRIHRRLSRALGSGHSRDFQKLRTSLIAELIGKGSQVKLRPAGRVGLEWARLSTGV
jgi:CRISPR-associated protein Csm1